MVANPVFRDQQGQSILEVVFVLPFLFLFVAFLYKVTMAVQTAINNTQYARSQVYVLTANSPEYPRLDFRFYNPKSFVTQSQDKIVLGVADPEQVDYHDASGNIEPVPQTQKIGRAQSTVKGSSERGEVTKRTEIRIRNTAAICTQLNSINPKLAMTSDNIPALKSQRWPFGLSVCQYKGEGSL